jgi:hypothetical protein
MIAFAPLFYHNLRLGQAVFCFALNPYIVSTYAKTRHATTPSRGWVSSYQACNKIQSGKYKSIHALTSAGVTKLRNCRLMVVPVLGRKMRTQLI